MYRTMERKSPGRHIWSFMFVLAIALAAIVAVPRKALAANRTLTDAKEIVQVLTGGAALTGDGPDYQGTGWSYVASTNTLTITGNVKTAQSGDLVSGDGYHDIRIRPAAPFNVDLDGEDATLDMGTGTLFLAGGTLQITGEGLLTQESDGNDNVIQVGNAITSWAPHLIIAGNITTYQREDSASDSGMNIYVMNGVAEVAPDAVLTTINTGGKYTYGNSEQATVILPAVTVGGMYNNKVLDAQLVVNGTVRSVLGATTGQAINIIYGGVCTVTSTGKVVGGKYVGENTYMPAVLVGSAKENKDSTVTPSTGTLNVYGTVSGYFNTVGVWIFGGDVNVYPGGTINGGGYGATGSAPTVGMGVAYSDPNNPQTNLNVQGGYISNTNQYNAVQMTGDNVGNVTITDSEVAGNVINNSDGSVTVNGSSEISGDVLNNQGGTVTVNDGTIAGTLANNGDGTVYLNGGTAGSVEGNIVVPPATPGSPEAVTEAVIAVKNPIADAARGYAQITVDGAGQAWTIDVTNPNTPAATAAQDIVAPVVTAVQTGGASSVTTGDTVLELPGATQAQIVAFAGEVLGNADSGVAPASLDATQATLTDLLGKSATFTAETSTTPMTFTFNFTGEAPEPPTPENTVAVYRLYNPYEKFHLYTTDLNEVETLSDAGWNDEGPYWWAPSELPAGGELIVRLYNPYNGDHYYVQASDTGQLDFLLGEGWRQDSAASSFYSEPSGGQYPVYTMFNPHSTIDTHLYTPLEPEVQNLLGQGWVENATIIWAASLTKPV